MVLSVFVDWERNRSFRSFLRNKTGFISLAPLLCGGESNRPGSKPIAKIAPIPGPLLRSWSKLTELLPSGSKHGIVTCGRLDQTSVFTIVELLVRCGFELSLDEEVLRELTIPGLPEFLAKLRRGLSLSRVSASEIKISHRPVDVRQIERIFEQSCGVELR